MHLSRISYVILILVVMKDVKNWKQENGIFNPNKKRKKQKRRKEALNLKISNKITRRV